MNVLGRSFAWAGVSSALTALVVFVPGIATARGLHLEPAPWYHVTLADTLVSFSSSVAYVDGPAPATLFEIEAASFHRGPVQFAARWGHVTVRQSGEHQSGLADPRVYARMRLRGASEPLASGWKLFLEASSKLPTAQAKLFPFAAGGQDIEMMGVVVLPRLANLHLGVGRIFAEPPGDSGLGALEVPHATHLWYGLAFRRAPFVLWFRGDALVFEVEGKRRGLFTSGLLHRNRLGFDLGLEHTFEASAVGERIYDHLFRLRFAMSVR